jgi:hypothetical protein
VTTPLYYFHLRHGGSLKEDPEGGVFADVQEATISAMQDARELMAAKIKNGVPIDNDSFELHDQDGALVAVVRFHDVLDQLIRR